MCINFICSNQLAAASISFFEQENWSHSDHIRTEFPLCPCVVPYLHCVNLFLGLHLGWEVGTVRNGNRSSAVVGFLFGCCSGYTRTSVPFLFTMHRVILSRPRRWRANVWFYHNVRHCRDGWRCDSWLDQLLRRMCWVVLFICILQRNLWRSVEDMLFNVRWW